MYIRSLEDHEIDNVDEVAEKWGRDVVKVFQENIAPTFKYPEVFEYGGIVGGNVVKSMANFLMRKSVVEICAILFKEAIADGSFFEEADLINETFPNINVKQVKDLFKEIE